METGVQTAADIARAFSEKKDANRAAALQRLLQLGVVAAGADVLCLYWRIRERMIAVDGNGVTDGEASLQQQIRCRIWPWLLRQSVADYERLLHAPIVRGAQATSHLLLLPLRDPRLALAGVMVLRLGEHSQERLVGVWREEAIGFADLVQAWLQAELDPQTALLSSDSFHAELQSWPKTPGHPRRDAAVLGIQLDYLADVTRICGAEVGAQALMEVLTLIQTRLRDRDIVGRTATHSLGVFLRQCSNRDALRVAAEIEAILVAYRFHWQQYAFTPHVRISVRALESPDRRQDTRSGRAATPALIEQRVQSRSTSAQGASGGEKTDAGGGLAAASSEVASKPSHESPAAGQVIILHRSDIPDSGTRSQQPARGTVEAMRTETTSVHGILHLAASDWRLQPCVELNHPGSIVAYRLRSIGADPAQHSRAESGPRVGLRRRLTPLLDRLEERITAGATLPVMLLDLNACTLLDNAMEWFFAACRCRRLPPESLCLSVSEELLITQLRTRLPLLQRLRRHGFALCVQTGAAGCTSPALLERLSPQFIRPAVQLVHAAGRDSAAVRVFAEQIRTTHALGARVLCGGIDSSAILSRCCAAAVDVGYGRACGASLSFSSLLERP